MKHWLDYFTTEDKSLPAWRWDKHRVRARTKSEARGFLKQRLGLARLPVGANVVRID